MIPQNEPAIPLLQAAYAVLLRREPVIVGIERLEFSGGWPRMHAQQPATRALDHRESLVGGTE